MSTPDKPTSTRCPACKGAGRVLLLFSWKTCDECGGTGEVVDEDEDTGEFEAVRDASAGDGCGEGSAATSRCDPEEDPSYFDDGLEFDDYGGFGGADIDVWGPED